MACLDGMRHRVGRRSRPATSTDTSTLGPLPREAVSHRGRPARPAPDHPDATPSPASTALEVTGDAVAAGDRPPPRTNCHGDEPRPVHRCLGRPASCSSQVPERRAGTGGPKATATRGPPAVPHRATALSQAALDVSSQGDRGPGNWRPGAVLCGVGSWSRALEW